MITLLLGGARSGKSNRALSMEKAFFDQHVFIATSEKLDAEMSERIEIHRQERDQKWITVEAPVNLRSALKNVDVPNSLIVIDCLTVWLGNLMHYKHAVNTEIEHLLESLGTAKGDYILVSNEVGQGIVPETKMAREFRDHQGRVNQKIAALADRVELVVAGIPLMIKSPNLKK